jgi:anti-sigma B factor antagonist
MQLTMELPDPDGTIRIRCVGQISQSRFPGSSDPLPDLLGPEGFKRKVRLDMERVDYVDSSGIGWLVGSHKRFREAGGQLLLARVPPIVEQVLRFCHLENLLNIERE